MNGLAGINIELTSRCNKSCWMCGRRKLEREHPELCDWGDMELQTAAEIICDIPKGTFIQWHWNGEPLLYPHLWDVLKWCNGHYMGLDTNGKLINNQKDALAFLSSVTISVIESDPEQGAQFSKMATFLTYPKRPKVVFRVLGEIQPHRMEILESWKKQYPNVEIAKRVLHNPDGSFDYEKPVTKPETGLCLEMLHKLAIDRYGDVFPCVRFDPHKVNRLGNVKDGLVMLWEGEKRKEWIQHHINGRRDLVPLCKDCHFWGVPRG